MIGASAGIDLGIDRRRRQVGRQQVAGRVDRRLHLLLGDIQMTSRPNCRVITDAPAELLENIWFRLGISPNWRSSGAVTEDVITSGLAPG